MNYPCTFTLEEYHKTSEWSCWVVDLPFNSACSSKNSINGFYKSAWFITKDEKVKQQEKEQLQTRINEDVKRYDRLPVYIYT